MRNGQKRMRGRNHRKSQNPLTRIYESNGPDVKIRGTASHIAEKYIQLARDAQGSGDPVAAENYYQHAEHYFRLIAAAQEQLRQQNSYYNSQQPAPGGVQAGVMDEGDEFGDDDAQPSYLGQNEPSYAPREPQPYIPRDAQPFPLRDQAVPQGGRAQTPPSSHGPQPDADDGQEGALPAFITGGPASPQNAASQNGGYEQDRFGGMHRRRRRHRGGYRGEYGGSPQTQTPQPTAGEGEDRQPD
jgi:hypothetical protein